MVLVTSVQTAGSLQELNVPAKSADVLEWLRGKLKQPGLQFQGKIQDKDSWVTVFAESGGEDDDDNIIVFEIIIIYYYLLLFIIIYYYS